MSTSFFSRIERARRSSLALLAATALALLGVLPVQAQVVFEGKQIVSIEQVPPEQVPAPEEVCILHPSGETANTYLLPSDLRGAVEGEALRSAEKNAEITVDYVGDFPQEAREAFERAAEIWETHITSSVEIRIEVSFEPLPEDDPDPNTLATAGTPVVFAIQFEDGTRSAYSSALTDAILGEDQRSGEPDIVARFNSERDDWYFDTGQPGSREIDFTSVAVHEIAHGLGFFGSMSVEDENGDEEGSWGFDFGSIEEPVPAIYDRFVEDLPGNRLINTDVYPNPSEELAEALTSENVFFNGPQARVGNTASEEPSDERPELYAPPEWNEGSSYSHLDEDAYPADDINSLMTPRIGFQEVVQTPGAVTCGMFADMGWELGVDCQVLLNIDLLAFDVEVAVEQEAGVEISWVLAEDTDVTEVEVQRRRLRDEYETIETIPVDDNSFCQEGSEGRVSCQFQMQDLEPGSYSFRLILVQADGSRTPGLERRVFVEPDRFVLHGPRPNPFRSQTALNVVVERSQRVIIDVYDAQGRLVRRLFNREVGQEEQVSFDAGSLSSGVYFFHVQGEDFTATEKAVLVR